MSPRFVVACAAPQKVVFYSDALRAVGVPAEEILGVWPGWQGEREDSDTSGAASAEAAVAAAAGFVLCGGEDVDPLRYGEATIPDAGVEMDPARDAFEWRLLDAARAAGTPVLGVCRGAQVLNVYLGGTLYQDLGLQRPSAIPHSILEPRDALAHTIEITAAEHPLASVLASGEVWVNSRHHQAVKELAPGLRPFAVAPDGLVEGYYLDPGAAGSANGRTESRAPWRAAGVQWHPENLVAMPLHRDFWTTFIAEHAR